jgi:Arc/MetJ-type ribon-helix-helix transcriptional regulator
MSTQTINISLPKELVEKIDDAAKIEFASRSDYIRQALVSKLRADKAQADDWDLLEALSAEIAQGAKDINLKSDDDFVRAVKDVRASKLANRK